MQYFSKKKIILPEGYFINSSQIPSSKDVNKLLLSCGSDTFPNQKLSLAIEKSNFFLLFKVNQSIKFMVLLGLLQIEDSMLIYGI